MVRFYVGGGVYICKSCHSEGKKNKIPYAIANK